MEATTQDDARTEPESLNKPDMVAVLERTNLRKDEHGFLLPILEAVSNAMHGIEAKFESKSATLGKVGIRFCSINDPKELFVSVSDNGVGLNDEEYKSFKTPFSGHKLKKRGRGFGRFIAFKVFSRIHYSSRHDFMGTNFERTFRFDIRETNEIIPHDGMPDFSGTGLCVELNNPLKDWHATIRALRSDTIVNEIASHFLPVFLYGSMPRIEIQIDDATPIDLSTKFAEQFVQSDSGEFYCDIDGAYEKVEYSIARIPWSSKFKSHSLMFSAADRIVGKPRDMSTLLGSSFFLDEEDEKYVVVSVVRSEAFETNLNNERTGINISPGAIENVASEMKSIIEKIEHQQIQVVKDEQAIGLDDALRDNPILRLGLKGRSIGEYVRNKPNSWRAENFVADLALERFRSTQDLSEAISVAVGDSEKYAQEINEIVGQIDATNKETLAEYVVHRKRVLELLSAARRFSEDGSRAPEDAVHDLIFKRFSDSTEKNYFEHNLWVVDDTLAFLPYVSSDRTMSGGRRKRGDKVPDLAFFDESLVLGADDGTAISIVEFKRPSRDDYRFGDAKHDPITQVIDTLEKATKAGGITKKDGEHLNFSGVVRRFGHVIADITPSLIAVLRKHDFKNDFNPDIWYRYRDHEEVLIQVMGFGTLIENARKRNQAFFTVLFGE